MNKTDLINYLDNNFEDDETDVVLVTRDNFKGFIVVNSNFKIHKETINGKQVAVIEENEDYTDEEKKFKIVNKDGTETVDWNYIQDYVHEILFTRYIKY